MKMPLKVSLHVQQPSIVELTVSETVVMDRLRPTPEGYAAGSCGELLIPGPTTLTLERGIYFFETVAKAHLRVIQGAVDAVTTSNAKAKVGAPRVGFARGTSVGVGDELTGEAPAFTVE